MIKNSYLYSEALHELGFINWREGRKMSIGDTVYLLFKLEFRDEYQGHELDEEKLYQHGFNGGRSIELPMCNNPLLFEYIETIFKKKGFVYIIDDVVPQDKSRELVKKTHKRKSRHALFIIHLFI